jgi:hypothetical protein
MDKNNKQQKGYGTNTKRGWLLLALSPLQALGERRAIANAHVSRKQQPF